MNSVLYLISACGALSIVYGIWAAQSVMSADAGNKRMQEIASAIQEGAQAYLTRQYTTITIAGVVIFILVAVLLSLPVAMGFFVGAVLSGAAMEYRWQTAAGGQSGQRAGYLVPGVSHDSQIHGRVPLHRVQVGVHQISVRQTLQ